MSKVFTILILIVSLNAHASVKKTITKTIQIDTSLEQDTKTGQFINQKADEKPLLKV